MSNNGERKQMNTARTLLAVVLGILGLVGFVLRKIDRTAIRRPGNQSRRKT